MGKLVAVCISEKKGVLKKPVGRAFLKTGYGIEGDAHAGNWHRQVSLLSLQKIEEFRSRGVDVAFGAFGENMVVDGIDLASLPVGTRIRVGSTAELELSQIGKDCHSHCAIYKAVGDCIMPREGVFTRVIKDGEVKDGDEITLYLPEKRPFTAAVITLSDKGAAGEREDRSGPLIKEMLEKEGYVVEETILLPDGTEALEKALIRLSDQREISVIFTTGGTGFSPRDLTPEATKAVSDREVPGIGEALRAYSMNITPRAMLSRQTAGIRKKTLIVNLPGSPKACREDLEFLLPVLPHGLGILRGTDGECGSPA